MSKRARTRTRTRQHSKSRPQRASERGRQVFVLQRIETVSAGVDTKSFRDPLSAQRTGLITHRRARRTHDQVLARQQQHVHRPIETDPALQTRCWPRTFLPLWRRLACPLRGRAFRRGVFVQHLPLPVPHVLLELEHHGAGVVETGAPDRVPSVPRPPPTMVTGWSTNAHALSVALQDMATTLGPPAPDGICFRRRPTTSK